MSARAHCCRLAVAGVNDRSTLKLDVGRRRLAVGRKLEQVHYIAIWAAPTLPPE